jgi:capsid assembly protease
MTDNLTRAWELLAGESAFWAIVPERLTALAAGIAREPGNGADSWYSESPSRIGALLSQAERTRAATRNHSAATSRTTAIVPILGPIAKRGSWLTDAFGLASHTGIRAGLARAVADPDVDRIVLAIDSPGGVASGTLETANAIAAAGKKKLVVAHVESAGSAAYWLASAANEIVLTPSGDVGSIGVFALHADMSRALDQAGITPTFVVSKASPYKVEANPYEPLGADAKASVQRDVDHIAGQFIAAVARGRRITIAKVKSEYGQGRMLNATDALRAGMVDRVATIEHVLMGSAGGGRSANSAAEIRLRRLALLTA